jgi:hypothetical protein
MAGALQVFSGNWLKAQGKHLHSIKDVRRKWSP